MFASKFHELYKQYGPLLRFITASLDHCNYLYLGNFKTKKETEQMRQWTGHQW